MMVNHFIKCIILLALIAIVAACSDEEENAWQQWLKKYGREERNSGGGRVMSMPPTFALKKDVFLANYQKVHLHNLRYKQRLETYSMQLGPNAIKTTDEFIQEYGVGTK